LKKPYSACGYWLGKPINKKSFETEFEAHRHWQLNKIEAIEKAANLYFSLGEISEQVYLKVLERASKIMEEYNSNTPTTFI